MVAGACILPFHAGLLESARYGVACGTAATMNQARNSAGKRSEQTVQSNRFRHPGTLIINLFMQGQIKHINRHLAACKTAGGNGKFISLFWSRTPFTASGLLIKSGGRFLRMLQQVDHKTLDARMPADGKAVYRAMGALQDTQLRKALFQTWRGEGRHTWNMQSELVIPFKRKKLYLF